MASHRCGFRCNTLHSTAITEESVCMVVDQIEAISVELRSRVCLCNCKTDSIGETLTQRSGCNFNAGCVMCFRVARCDAIDLSEVLKVVDRECVAEEMKECILEHASVAVAVGEFGLAEMPNFAVQMRKRGRCALSHVDSHFLSISEHYGIPRRCAV